MAEMRTIAHTRTRSLKTFFLRWEWMLVLLFIVVNIVNASISRYYLDGKLLIAATSTFMDRAFIVLPMVFVIIMGDIDISVASTLTLSSVIMGVTYNMGLAMPAAMVLCVGVATLCGLLNGYLIVKFKELSSVIVTLATMIIYRGLAFVILEDQAAGNFPGWYRFLGWGNIGIFPFILIVFVIFAAIFLCVLNWSTLGRKVYAIGSNKTTSRYSGVRVGRIKLFVFTLTGFMTGIAALFLSSRLGSTRPNIALGYELDVIAIVVLGGISTAGGKGTMTGALIAIILVGYLRYGLGLVNVEAQIVLIITGLLLILAVLLPNITQQINAYRHKRARKV